MALTRNVHTEYQMDLTTRASSDVARTPSVHKRYQVEFTTRASSNVALTPTARERQREASSCESLNSGGE